MPVTPSTRRVHAGWGRDDDPRTVVDSQGQVLGVERLRVVDASIMPTVVRANTHLTTVMLAEHIAASW